MRKVNKSRYTREDKTARACMLADDNADAVFGDDGIARTVRPTQVAEVTETVVLETPKASVVDITTGRDLSWLAADVFSTRNGYRS